MSEHTTHRAGPLALAVGALGVVYGDIGTSPLYALREGFTHGGLALTAPNVLGVLSMMVWALVLVVTLKYVAFVLRADNRGEGGILALTALALNPFGHPRVQQLVLVLGLAGAALFYGDALITPAISVLSAVEGLHIISPAFDDWVMPLAVAIIVTLFAVQRYGTAVMGAWFGPICVLWFGVMGVLGLAQVVAHPLVLGALSPLAAWEFMQASPMAAFVVVGAVVLVLTGAEAIYADMGHFGRKPIQRAWVMFVLPCLVLNYLGQGALLLHTPSALENPFYLLAPPLLQMPLVVLATMATVIASQAVISGAFSMTQQAIQLGYLPRFEVRHTAADAVGQIYLPQLNWLMAVLVVGLMWSFGNSSNLAAAYGVAVTGTMLLTTILVTGVLHRRLHWPLWLALGFGTIFLVLDATLLAATLTKVPQGGWFPLVLGAMLLGLMLTWIHGRAVTKVQINHKSGQLEHYLKHLPAGLHRPAQIGVYLTGDLNYTPMALRANVAHNNVLHATTLIVKVTRARVPRYPARERLVIHPLGNGITTLEVTYGFMETPHIPHALAQAEQHGLVLPKGVPTTYYLSCHRYVAKAGHGLSWLQEPLYVAMENLSMNAAHHFHLPPRQTLELSDRLEI